MKNLSSATFPFAAVVGHHAARRALLLLAIDPGLRGALIASGDSAARRLARGLAELLPNRADQETSRLVELPVNVTEDRLLGGIDLERTIATAKPQISKGLLAIADGGLLHAAEVNLLELGQVSHIAHALDSRQVRIEREGISAEQPADFILIGTFDLAEGDAPSLLRDRVGLIVSSNTGSSTDRAQTIDRDLRFDSEPVGLAESFALETAELKSLIEAARARLPKLRVTKQQRRQIAYAARALGVEGNRADVFALRAARANAALSERLRVDEDDLLTAIELVLLPRATTLPAPPDECSKDESNSLVDDSEREARLDERDSVPGAVEDLIIKAIDASVPDDLLSYVNQPARSFTSGGRFKAPLGKRGRYSRSTNRKPRAPRVAIDATLRAAAPYQLARRLKSAPHAVSPATATRERGVKRIYLEPDDLRFKQFKHRSGVLFIFAVDASGSMAINRMAQAKGALIRLLGNAYLHRDKVALISFRGDRAQVLLAPTRSVELAKRLVEAVPAGGGTPIAAAIVKAIALERLARLRGDLNATLVLFTDGRANVPLRESQERSPSLIDQELGQLGRVLHSEGISSVVVDTRSRFVSGGEARRLAETVGARYHYLGGSRDRAAYDTIASLVRERP